jgi:hypothetical protein
MNSINNKNNKNELIDDILNYFNNNTFMSKDRLNYLIKNKCNYIDIDMNHKILEITFYSYEYLDKIYNELKSKYNVICINNKVFFQIKDLYIILQQNNNDKITLTLSFKNLLSSEVKNKYFPYFE